MSLLQSASSKKAMQRKKGKANMVYMKKRKQTENGKTPGSEQLVVKSICGSLTMRRRAASAVIIRHHTSLNAQPSSWRELRTTKGPLCVNSASRVLRQRRAQAKLLTREFACATVEGEGDSSEQRISLLRRQGHTRTSNTFGRGRGLKPIYHICLCM